MPCWDVVSMKNSALPPNACSPSRAHNLLLKESEKEYDSSFVFMFYCAHFLHKAHLQMAVVQCSVSSCAARIIMHMDEHAERGYKRCSWPWARGYGSGYLYRLPSSSPLSACLISRDPWNWIESVVLDCSVAPRHHSAAGLPRDKC